MVDSSATGMEALAGLAALNAALAGLPEAYRVWIATRRVDIPGIDGSSRRATAERLMMAAEQAAGRIAAGIGLLKPDGWARLAFRTMNEALARAAHQRAAIQNGRPPAEQATPAWCPFQLAFVLLNLSARGVLGQHPGRWRYDGHCHLSALG